MKKTVLGTTLLVILSSITINGTAQNNQTKAVLTADSLATGNYKDILSSFFQLAFDKLTGKDKELKFSSNPYAVMMKANKDLELYNNYKKNRVLRNLNFNFSIRLDTSYHFNGFSSGISYALINKRDFTVYDEFIDLALIKSQDFHLLNKAVAAGISGMSDDAAKDRVRGQVHKLLTDEAFTFNQLDADVKTLVQKILRQQGLTSIEALVKKNGNASFRKAINDGYEAVKKSFQSKPLLTFSVNDTTYKDQFMFSNLVMKLEYLQGFGDSKPGANWEFNIPAAVNFLNDTLQPGRDLKRSVFRIEPGINLVIRNSDAEHSFFEMKFSGEYNHIFSGMYAGEKKDKFTFNGTLRVRIINEIWIPLQFKYDPKSGNVFGFLSVRLNFSGQAKEKK